jgi:aspartate/methionine/tyrosine aminotransferase
MGATQNTRCDVMVYSMSKLTGHAGTRFGWALIKDRKLFESATDVMVDLTLGISVDAQVSGWVGVIG